MPYLAQIRVVGVGGGGSTAVRAIMSHGPNYVDYVVVDSEPAQLATAEEVVLIRLDQGSQNTPVRGGDPAAGRHAALTAAGTLRQASFNDELL